MDEFGVESATLAGEDWSVSFSRTIPTATTVVAAPVASAEGVHSAAPTARKTPKSVPASAPVGTPISSPMMGIYYSASSPGSPPFVKEGDMVQAGQVVGLIEAMKVYNEIVSSVSGTVKKIAAQNGALVQPGEPLLYIG